MKFEGQQAAALLAVQKWLRDTKGRQIFRIFGFAGTGKTTIAKEIAAMVPGQVLFCSFTGKAALVLKGKGCTPSSTIHSLIYKPIEDPVTGETTFILNPDSDAGTADLIIVDEVSMVGEDIGRDLLSFGTRILVLGDPAQLPPIKGTGFFTSAEPDVMLTEIHRQAADNPIIRLSIDVREGRPLALGYYGDSKVITRDQVDQQEILTTGQVLVGMNKTRRAFNARIRSLLGRSGKFPEPGDRVICLRNNKEKQLLNGGMWTVQRSKLTGAKHKRVAMEVLSLDDDSIIGPLEVETPVEFFYGTEADLEWQVRKKHDEFDHGYAISVHKSQGSQWDNVVIFDESRVFRENAMNHLYTAITRAAERVTVVI